MSTVDAKTPENTAAVAAERATVAPEKAASKKKASRKKGAPKAKKGVEKANPKRPAKKAVNGTPKAKATPPQESSKKDIVLDLLRRPKGATMAELMEATSWQAHSVRGFISGALGKKMDLPVISAKREDGARVYSLAK